MKTTKQHVITVPREQDERQAITLLNRMLVDRFCKQVVNSFGYAYVRRP